MKRKVVLSNGAIVFSALILLCLLIILYATINSWEIIFISCVIVILLGLTLIYMPLSISVDNNNLVIKRPIKSKIIPISEINSVSLTPPTMGERRICASGGFFGYWGWFKERELGKYFAYYGKASDCFFVKLSNGRNYMIGCEDPQQITSFLQKRMEK